MATLSAEAVVRVAAHAALDKKAIDVAVLDLQGLSTIADFFLVCSARSTTASISCCTRRPRASPVTTTPCSVWSQGRPS